MKKKIRATGLSQYFLSFDIYKAISDAHDA